MNLNYRTPTEIRREVTDLVHWADVRNTNMAVATAIHALADSKRSAEMIWEEPTSAEWNHVEIAVEQYVRSGFFEPESDGCYHWGEATIDGPAE